MKRRIAQWMRKWADRLDHHGAPKLIGWTFTFERGEGIVFHDRPISWPRPKGCRLAYLGDDEYERAHTEADNPC